MSARVSESGRRKIERIVFEASKLSRRQVEANALRRETRKFLRGSIKGQVNG